MLARVAPHITDRDPPVLGMVLHDLHVFLAPFLGEGREREAYDLAIVGRIHAEIAVSDGFLDRAHSVAIMRFHDEQTSLGHAEARQLLQRHFGAVVVDEEFLDEGGSGAPGTYRRELAAGVLDRLGHLVDGLEERLVDHRTSVPIGRPSKTQRTLPGREMSKTTIGRSLSMQNVIAVESITLRPLLSTSK